MKEYKTKNETKNTTADFRSFLESNFVGVTRLFLMVCSNLDDNLKGDKAQNIKKYNVKKEAFSKKYNVIIYGRNFCNQSILIMNNMKTNKRPRLKLTGPLLEDHITRSLLYYNTSEIIIR